MNGTKLHKLSDDELIKYLESGNLEIKEDDNLDETTEEIVEFIDHYGLREGKFKILEDSLFTLFKMWKQQPEYNKRAFVTVFSIIFKRMYRNKTHYYKLNRKAYALISPLIKKKPKIRYSKMKAGRKLIEEFAEKYEIKEGNYYIEGDILYFLFNNFIDSRKSKFRISYPRFFKLLGLYIPRFRKTTKYSWFCVDKSIIKHLDEGMVRRWREGRKKYGRIKIETHKNLIKQFIIYQEGEPDEEIEREVFKSKTSI